VKIADLRPGDRIAGFAGFGCIPNQAIRTVQVNSKGELFVNCSGTSDHHRHQREEHLLDVYENDEETGLFIATPESMRAYRKLLRGETV